MKEDEQVYEEFTEDSYLVDDLTYKLIQNDKMYSYKVGATKAVTSFLLFLVPVLIDQFLVSMPDVANLTLGGLLVMAWNYVKFQLTRV